MSASRWDSFLWPRWLPETARLPLVAQITGAVALTALIMGPWWSRVPTEIPASKPAAVVEVAPLPAAVAQSPATEPAPPKPVGDSRPAHLNLDVRHSFRTAALTVVVDGKRVLDSTLEGSGKKFKMFGKRAERGYTRSLELQPGVRVVRVRMQSPADKFDQTRTERFDLGAASVASMRITADNAGLDVITQHPPPQTAIEAAAAPPPPQPQPAPVAAATLPVPTLPSAEAQRADAVAELLQSLRSMLIAIAGFVASAATGFIVQEYLRGKKELVFAKERRRKRRRENAEDEISAA